MKNTIIHIKKRGQSPEAVIADAKRAKRKADAGADRKGIDVTRSAARKAMVSGLITKKQQQQLIEVLNILDNDAMLRYIRAENEQNLAEMRRNSFTFDANKVKNMTNVLGLGWLGTKAQTTDRLFVNGLFRPQLVSENEGVLLMTAEEFLDFSENADPTPENYMAKWSDGVLHETGKGREFEEIIESIKEGTGHSHVICYYVGDAK